MDKLRQAFGRLADFAAAKPKVAAGIVVVLAVVALVAVVA